MNRCYGIEGTLKKEKRRVGLLVKGKA